LGGENIDEELNFKFTQNVALLTGLNKLTIGDLGSKIDKDKVQIAKDRVQNNIEEYIQTMSKKYDSGGSARFKEALIGFVNTGNFVTEHTKIQKSGIEFENFLTKLGAEKKEGFLYKSTIILLWNIFNLKIEKDPNKKEEFKQNIDRLIDTAVKKYDPSGFYLLRGAMERFRDTGEFIAPANSGETLTKFMSDLGTPQDEEKSNKAILGLYSIISAYKLNRINIDEGSYQTTANRYINGILAQYDEKAIEGLREKLEQFRDTGEFKS
jgi:hypothetical protein